MKTNAGTKQRPIALLVLVVVAVVVGAFVTSVGLYFIYVGRIRAVGPDVGLLALFGLIVLVPGLLELLLAYGLWKFKVWAWWLGVIAHGLVAPLLGLIFFGVGLAEPSMLVALGLFASVVCLFTPQVKRAFRPE